MSTVFVQVTTNRPHGHKQYEEFASMFATGTRWLEQWVWYDNSGWVKYEYHHDKRTRTDMRK